MIVDASADPSFPKDLETALLADLRASSAQGTNSKVELAVRNVDGALLAGLSGSTSYGWLCIKMLWVSTGCRRSGLGTELIKLAVDLSISRACHSAWLETSNPVARAFYERMGFIPFATLKNHEHPPSKHARWFMKRTL